MAFSRTENTGVRVKLNSKPEYFGGILALPPERRIYAAARDGCNVLPDESGVPYRITPLVGGSVKGVLPKPVWVGRGY
ncbi:MAG: hypothetical protein ABSF10_02455 [Verrucomicrobiota bacterium]|jgi:hypothetical protein